VKHFVEICLYIKLVAIEIFGLIGLLFLLWRGVRSEWKKP
jgi:hypothetical protein